MEVVMGGTDTDHNLGGIPDDSAWYKVRGGLESGLLDSIQDKLDTRIWMRLHTLIRRPLLHHIDIK